MASAVRACIYVPPNLAIQAENVAADLMTSRSRFIVAALRFLLMQPVEVQICALAGMLKKEHEE